LGVEFEIDVQSLKAIQKAFEEVTKELSSGSLVARAALIIERQAKINASGRPGPKVQTGRLRASITTEVIDTNTARVGTNVFYAPFVEFGHSTLVGKGTQLGAKMNAFDIGMRQTKAYPFLGPTIEQTKGDMTNVMVTFGNELGAKWSQ